MADTEPDLVELSNDTARNEREGLDLVGDAAMRAGSRDVPGAVTG